MKKPERIVKKYTINVGFPSGTLEQCIKQLSEAHSEAVLSNENNNDGLETDSILFGVKCYGYEDYEYELEVVRKEPNCNFESRLAEWKSWSENKKARDAEDRAKWAEIARQRDIEELKRKLAELENSK